MTHAGSGINGSVKPNMDQLINLPGLNSDYSDDPFHLKGGGGNSSGVIRPGVGSPGSGFGSQKASLKI